MAKTPGLNLPYGIDPVNPVPVDSKYGPYTDLAEAKSSIPLSLRYDGLTVNIIGTGEYWWTSDLSDTGLAVKGGGGSGGGSELPIAAEVYLVGSATDQTRMGGTAANVYTTFQEAYEAADALQLLLGGTNLVVINVGVCTALQVGNLILTASYNSYVNISGISRYDSVLGDITCADATINDYSLVLVLNNISVGNIYANSGNIDLIGLTINILITDAYIISLNVIAQETTGSFIILRNTNLNGAEFNYGDAFDIGNIDIFIAAAEMYVIMHNLAVLTTTIRGGYLNVTNCSTSNISATELFSFIIENTYTYDLTLTNTGDNLQPDCIIKNCDIPGSVQLCLVDPGTGFDSRVIMQNCLIGGNFDTGYVDFGSGSATYFTNNNIIGAFRPLKTGIFFNSYFGTIGGIGIALPTTLTLFGCTVRTSPRSTIACVMNVNNTYIPSTTATTLNVTYTNETALQQVVFNNRTANYTLVYADRSKVVTMNLATALTVTIPLNSSIAFPIGTQITIIQEGVGQVDIAGAVGVTILSSLSRLRLANQYSSATLIKKATDTWYLVGDLTA